MAQEIRIYTEQPLAAGETFQLSQGQAHYLANVMRCKTGDKINIFNGRDGQWQAEICEIGKKSVTATALKQTRAQAPSPDLHLAFAPIKNKSDLVVEKATELGVSKITTVVTKHCVVRMVNLEKLTAHIIEASEQCERLDVPTIETANSLSSFLGSFPQDRTLLYGDETGGGTAIYEVLSSCTSKKLAVLIGPEGGFSGEEIAMLKACKFAKPFGLGPRILRADTAAVAAIACIQARFGDMHLQPHFISGS